MSRDDGKNDQLREERQDQDAERQRLRDEVGEPLGEGSQDERRHEGDHRH